MKSIQDVCLFFYVVMCVFVLVCECGLYYYSNNLFFAFFTLRAEHGQEYLLAIALSGAKVPAKRKQSRRDPSQTMQQGRWPLGLTDYSDSENRSTGTMTRFSRPHRHRTGKYLLVTACCWSVHTLWTNPHSQAVYVRVSAGWDLVLWSNRP